jgi:Tfp pilus assembly protein PilV
MVHSRARLKAASEDGFGLIEVLVSAMVLVIVVLGSLAAIDAVTSTAGANKARTIAATLAEKDLERLRSMRTSDLARLAQIEAPTQQITVENITYTVASKAQSVTDSTGEEVSCALSPQQGTYFRISSTVTSTVTGGAVKPVVLSSIVAPRPGKGTLSAVVKNAAGQPVMGIPVQAIGPSPGTAATNAAGCAVFADREAGSYTLRLDSSGWVDTDGNQVVEENATVSAGNLTTIEFLYDEAASFDVKVVTKVGGVERDDRANGVIAAHTGLSTLFKAKTAVDPGLATYSYTGMFPFTAPYQVYGGRCTANDPSKPPNENFFSTFTDAAVQLTPGEHAGTFKALEPAIDVKVTWNGGTLASNAFASVYAYPKDANCGSKIDLGRTNAAGKLVATAGYPGLPFGTYDLCVHYRKTATFRDYKYTAVVSNSDPAGTLLPIDFTALTTQGTCP